MELPLNIRGMATVDIEEEGVIKIKILPNTSVDLGIAKDIVKCAGGIAGPFIHANMIDIREMVFMSREARAYLGKQDKAIVIAVAILMKSIFHGVLSNLYLTITKPLIPTKVFEKEIDALDWLRKKLSEIPHDKILKKTSA
jgi:hypothetical protein